MGIDNNSQYSVLSTQYNAGRIGILMGGPSSERDISLKSGRAVFQALKQSNLSVVDIDIKSDSIDENRELLKAHKIDCAFIALHGRFGEDGQIQEILDSLAIPYTGSGTMSSNLSMDKIASRRILEAAAIIVPKYQILDRNSYKSSWRLKEGIAFPLVVKPSTHGSSIGLSVVDAEENLSRAIELAFAFDKRIIIEEYIKGREITVGILGNKVLPVIEIIPKNKFFDYSAKYQSGLTQYIVPAQLDAYVAKKIRFTASQVHRLLGCHGCSRVDMILNEDNIPFVLELNSIPGFTPASLLPKAAKVAGIEFDQLCLQLINLAYEKE